MASNFLFGTSALPNVTTTDTTNTAYPSWYQSFLNAIMGKASAVAGEPYQQYGGPRVAGPSQDQQAAYSMVRQGIGQYQPMINQANNYLTSSGQAFNPSQLEQYMSPYTNDVVNRIADLGQRNLTENLLPAVNNTFIKSGNFGSRENADFTQRAIRDSNESILGAQSSALQAGYSDAMKNLQQQRANELNAGTQLGNLAQTGQGVGLRDAAALEGIGSTQQNLTQKSYDTAYQDFLNQTQYPQQQVGFLSNIIRGIAAPTQTTSTQTGPGNANNMAPNPLSQVLGAGIGLSGILGQLGLKKGGEVSADKPKPSTKHLKVVDGIGFGSRQRAMSRAKTPKTQRGIGGARMAA